MAGVQTGRGRMVGMETGGVQAEGRIQYNTNGPAAS